VPGAGVADQKTLQTSDSLDEAVPSSDYRRYIRWGMVVIVVLLGGFGVWALTAPLSGAVVAPGQTAVASQTKTIRHRSGGLVSRLHVSEGDRVSQGDSLLSFEPTQARSELRRVQARLVTGLAKEARLTAEMHGDDKVRFPARLDNIRAPAIDVAAVKANQRAVFASRRSALASNLTKRDNRISTLQARIDGLDLVIDSLNNQIDSYAGEIAERRDLYEDKLTNKEKLRQAKRRKLDLEAKLSERRSERRELKAKIETTRTEKRLAQRQYHKEVTSRLAKVRSKILEAESRLPALEQKLTRKQVNAPTSGQVVDLTVHTRGTVVKPGGQLLQIVPLEEAMIIEARVPPKDIDHIAEGQNVRLRFAALGGTGGKPVTGTVASVSADTLREQQNTEPYYLSRIRVDEGQTERLREMGLTLEAGMPVTAMIETGERTFFEYMTEPIRDMISRSLREP
jgi:epimerase transport system membrane fusion protein